MVFGWGKKEEIKPKTLEQMSSAELKEFQKEIKRELRTSIRDIDRQIFQSDRLIKSAQRDVEKKIKEGASKQVIKTYAKNAVQAMKAKEKHLLTKTKIQGVEYSLNQMVMNIKMTKVMGKATHLMKDVNSLARIPEIQNTIMGVQQQMEKHGLVTELMNDAMEEFDDDVDVDEDVDKLIDEMEDKVNGGKQKVTQTHTTTKKVDDFDEQIKNLALQFIY